MATRYTDEFRRDAVSTAITIGLSRPQVSSDLRPSGYCAEMSQEGVGLSTLNKWVQKHQHDDLMSGPHEGVAKGNERLRNEVCLLREEREVVKRPVIFFAGQSTSRAGKVHGCVQAAVGCRDPLSQGAALSGSRCSGVG